MGNENYENWEPTTTIWSGELFVEAVHDDFEGFRILLRSEASGILRIRFDGAIGYRNINESYRLRTFTRFVGGFFRMYDSEWIRWLKLESGGVLDDKRLVHYGIFTNEDCIEVVSEFPPEVEWLD